MRRLLIISPHFPPVNAPDMQRVRMSLPHFREFGWEPHVIAVAPEHVEFGREPLLLDVLPPKVPVHRCPAFSVRWTRRFGIGAIGLRAWPFLRRAGAAMMRAQRPDLVYFSTTAFPVMTLGRLWKKNFGVPFVLDMQDPWVSNYYDQKTNAERPPKHGLAQRMHRTLEPWTMKAVDGIVAVSEQYHVILRERYPWIGQDVCHTIPFGASEQDFEVAAKMNWRNPIFTRGNGLIHGVYVGVLGRVMAQTCRAICLALKQGLERDLETFSRLRLHFIGTDYAPTEQARQTIGPIAAELGLTNHVHEDVNRVPYFSALRLLQDADFLIMPGSDNPHYTASKVYPYILAKRPLLAIFHRDSSVVDVLKTTRAGRVATYGTNSSAEEIASALLPEWSQLLHALPFIPDTNWLAFQPYTAREMTRRQCELFDYVASR